MLNDTKSQTVLGLEGAGLDVEWHRVSNGLKVEGANLDHKQIEMNDTESQTVSGWNEQVWTVNRSRMYVSAV
jgi:hypothetical protein